MAENKPSRMKLVMEFLREGANRPVTLPEFRDFWQSCSEQERAEFADYVESLKG